MTDFSPVTLPRRMADGPVRWIQRHPWRLVVLGFLLGSSLYLAGLLANHHAIRASLIRVQEVTDPAFFRLPPERMPSEMQFERPELLGPLRAAVPDSIRLLPTGSAEQIDALLHWSVAHPYPSLANASIAVPEAPVEIFETYAVEHQRGSCYNDAILFAGFAQSLGMKARVVNFNGSDGMGGSGHTVTEVWSPPLNRWVHVDTQQACLLIDRTTGLPLSTLDVRERALTLSPEAFDRTTEIRQYPGFLIPADHVRAYYASRSVDLTVIASGAFETARQEKIGYRVSSWIEANGSAFGPLATQFGRFIRARFDPSLGRYRLVDRFTPNISYGWRARYPWIEAIWLVSGGLWLFWLVQALVRRRRRRSFSSDLDLAS